MVDVTINNVDVQIADSDQFVKDFLQEYMENGIGVMSKREIDILVMNLLMNHGDLASKSNYDLSIMLQTPETRIKGLRYEARLRYPPDEEYVEREFLFVLARSQFDADKKKIVFIIEDKYLRYAIQGRLKAKGMYADSSFNTEIVKIDHSALETIIREMYGDESAKKYRKDFDKVLKQGGKLTFRDVKKNFILSAVKTLGSALSTMAVAQLQILITQSPF